ncbi:hypothetical protein [Thermococcus indicus]|uniref:hypothetical protein n=1 Tax=Thermococcus indicus TaxID=2586643 RepID=UPI001F10CD9C|nr:hypothetical protein [Thermococcus indicus]
MRKQIKRQKKMGKVHNIEQRLIYVPSKAELPEEVYLLTPEELKELFELIPAEKRPSWRRGANSLEPSHFRAGKRSDYHHFHFHKLFAPIFSQTL